MIALSEYEIPYDTGGYIWDWYCDLLDWVDAVENGVAVRIPPSEMLAWAKVTGNIVSVDEYAILRNMNAAWCAAMNVELQYSRDLKADRDRQAGNKKG